MDIEKIEEIRRNLNEFSFTKVVIKENENDQDLKWCKDFANKTKNSGFCRDCEKSNCANAQGFEGAQDYKLHFVSHGAHSLDFCDSMGIKPDNDWNNIPVLFLFENPSVQHENKYGELYEKKEIEYDNEKKYPAKKWYWIHEGYTEKECIYPKKYKQGRYGGLIASLIKTFKLANAYMTNIVKCSMNNSNGTKYLGTQYYKEECIENCIKEVLKEEINILTDNKGNDKPIIFAFSKQVYNLAQKYLSGVATEICLMPHPASRLANDYRKYVIFGKVYKTLTINGCDCKDAVKEFLKKPIRFDKEDIKNIVENYWKDMGVSLEENCKKNNSCVIWVNETGTEIQCKIRIEKEMIGFGFNSLDDNEYWFYDCHKKEYLHNLESYNQDFTKLYNAFCEFIESKENP